MRGRGRRPPGASHAVPDPPTETPIASAEVFEETPSIHSQSTSVLMQALRWSGPTSTKGGTASPQDGIA